METIKNLLSGKSTDEQTQHTSGTSVNPTHSGTGTSGVAGEGSHLAGAHGTTGTSGTHNTSSMPGAFDTTTGTSGSHVPRSVEHPSTTSGTGSSNLGRDAAVGTGATGTSSGLAHHPKHTNEPGSLSGHDQLNSPTYTHQSGTGTGLSNTQNTGIHSTGANDQYNSPVHGSSTLNKADPRVDTQSSTSGVPHSSHTGSVSEATTDQHGNPVHGSNTHSSATSGTPYGSTAGHSSGTTGSHTTGQPVHNSSLLNKVDPRVDTQTSGTSSVAHSSNTSSGNHPGRDAAALGTAGAVGAGAHQHHQGEQKNLGTSGQGYSGANPTGTSTGYGTSGTGSHGNTSGLHQTTGTSTNAGPHDSNIANKADPRVDSDRDGRANPTSHTGTSSGSHVGRDAAALGTAGAVGAGAHHHRENERDNLATSGQGYSGTTPSGTSSAYHGGPQGSAVSGPHQTDTANRLDPNVNTSGTGSRGVGLEDAHHHSERHGGGAEEADSHHSGSTAATGAGVAGVAGLAGQHQRHENTTGVGHSTTGGHSGNTGAAGIGHTSSGATGYGTSTNAGLHDSNLANKADPRVDSDRDGRSNPASHTTGAGYGTTGHNTTGTGLSHDNTATHGSSDHSHSGRNTALGAGAVGAAGLAGREHNKHDNATSTGHTESGQRAFPIGGGTTGQTTGTTHNTGTSTNAGPHDSNVANKADPRVDSDRDGRSNPLSHTAGTTGHSTTGTGAGHSTTHSNTQGTTGHNVGRDAAAGTGVAGAGLAAHEHNKHETSSALPGPAPNTAGPHSKDWLNKLDPRVHSKGDSETTGTHDSHTGRNTAGAGVVGAGAGAYAADKHHDKHDPSHTSTSGTSHSTTTGTTGHSTGTTTAGPHSSNVANKADPSVDSDRSKDHHYGRDAAGVGAVGAGAYAADKHHDKHNVNEPGHSTTGTGHSTTTGTTGHSTTTAGPHSSNVANKADPTVDSDRSKDHNYGRNAAGVGAVGAGAYEADKHHKHDKHDVKDEKHHDKHEKDHSKGGILSFLHRDKNKKYTPAEEAEFDRQEREHNSHKGLGAAGTGAAGVGAYEAGKHHEGHSSTGASSLDNKPLPNAPGNHGVGTGAGAQNVLSGDHSGRNAGVSAAPHHGTQGGAVPLDEKPLGSDLGDKLHGTARNRGTAHPHETTSGSHGIGGDHHTSGATGTTGSTGHHTGRDATALGGAAAVGEHEHRKHDNTTGAGVGGYDNSSNLGSSGTHGTGYGTSTNAGPHDSNLANKADPRVDSDRDGRANPTSHTGATGYDTQSSTVGSGLTGNHGTSHTTHGAGYGDSDRNRLHKDAPSSHPASGHVPASSSERSNLVGQGQNRLEDDTGVANSPANPNASTNY